MNDEETTLVQEIVDALDGTVLHELTMEAGAARGSLIASAPSGRRFSIVISATQIRSTDKS